MKRIHPAVLAAALLVFPGCGLADLIDLSCGFMDDPDHCYQSAAVQGSDPEKCEKIEGQGFSGSNPPKDKCYLQIAQNTGEYATCNEIEGGMMSYTVEECVTNIVVKNGDPEGCANLSGEAAIQECKDAFVASITSDKLKEINEAVENAKREGDKDALQKLLKQQAAMFENAPEGAKAEFMKSSREAILEGVDDDDVKAEIVRQTLAVRDANTGMSLNDQLAKMEEIKEQQELVKRLDEHANTLMDQIKEGASSMANDTFDDLYGDDVKELQTSMEKRGRAFLEEKGGEQMKAGIAQLESLKEKYDKASEQYEKINEQVEKLKKVYDEAAEVYAKVDEVNKLVGEGKVDAGRAQALYGAIYLGKGLEYATSYIPVFGSTASTVSKEVMDATLKFATSRAARTTAIDKCIDDPENCDPTGITPY
jgi:tetratricopeptide (TPR) repeat protein